MQPTSDKSCYHPADLFSWGGFSGASKTTSVGFNIPEKVKKTIQRNVVMPFLPHLSLGGEAGDGSKPRPPVTRYRADGYMGMNQVMFLSLSCQSGTQRRAPWTEKELSPPARRRADGDGRR